MIFVVVFVVILLLVAKPMAVSWRVKKEIATFRHYEDGYEYVYVEEDGTVREVTEEEIKYLESLFHPVDGPQPFKYYYEQLTSDKQMCGFIERIKIPRAIDIKPATNRNKLHRTDS